MKHTTVHTPDLSFYNSKKYKLTLCLSTALFFFLFLMFFLPFGVSNYNPRHQYTAQFLLMMLIFSGVTFSFSAFNEFVLRPLIFRSVNYKRIVLWSIWTFVLLGIANFFTYNILGNWHDFRFRSALEFIVNCSSVLVFPTVGTFFYFRFQALQQQVNHVLTNIDTRFDPNQLITFSGQGNNDRIALSLAAFQYARAQDNYVELYYLEQEKLAKFLIRASMVSLAESIANRAIVRCHRSYIVNLYHVKSVIGSSELKLYLDPFDTVIPVSKSYRDNIMSELRAVKNFG